MLSYVFLIGFLLTPLVGLAVAPTHYDVNLVIDTSGKSITGCVRVQLERPTGTLILHLETLTVDSVRFRNRHISFTQASDSLRLLDLKAKEATIFYHGIPRRGLKIGPDEIFTAFHTAAWMPVDDNPNAKATFDLRLILPSTFSVVGAGREIVCEKQGSVTTWHFKEPSPIPAYVFGFAAGRWTESDQTVGSVKLRYLGEGYSKPQFNSIFSCTAAAIRAFERITGITYPAGTYTQILTHAENEQEADGYCLLSNGYGSDVLKEPRENWLIIHELCHQWFGNRVTCKSWSDYWLHEGLTTYLTACVKGEMFEQDEFDREIGLARMRYAHVLEAGRDRAIVWNGWKRPEDMGGVITYYKAALVLNLLRSQIGDSAFGRGIRTFAKTHRNGNVITADFEKAMERSCGNDLSLFFAYWFFSDKCPDIQGSYTIAGDSLNINISQRSNAYTPLNLVVAVETDLRRDTVKMVLDAEETTIRIPLHGSLRSVRFDAANSLPIAVRSTMGSEMLVYQSVHEPDVLGRVQAMSSIVDLFKKSQVSKDAVVDFLRERQKNDPARFGREVAARSLSDILKN